MSSEAERRQAARKRNVTVSVTVIGVFVLAVAVLFAFGRPGPEAVEQAGLSAGESQLVRADSHRLQSAADGKVTLVEFLDFECEGCLAYYPAVEELREDYARKVTFVARYFPMPGHFNGERAARAVEAAAAQGAFEAMYRRMYETQPQWGEKRVPADETFRGFAKDLGLDLAAWDRAYDDPATLARIRKDMADGRALGVQGTPTFFLNGTRIEPRTLAEFRAAIDAALAE
ncbi:DsbA family protein [Nonomuraea ceibae]|uniref:DsbA family protein n=1 Tax=Nonomuraea ceibae TaxID=1935170 RepID=UPI0027E1C578|nr:thioredoxin domain-containing protein [Nonomuraea ceibae]